MTFEEFLKLVDQTYNHFHWRYGQCVMNVLHSAWKEKYDELVNTDIDCYYDDSLVEQVLNKLEKEWHK